MEAADHHRHAGGAQRPGDVERARKLVRLHADQADESEAAVAAQAARMIFSGRMRVLVSSTGVTSIATSGPST